MDAFLLAAIEEAEHGLSEGGITIGSVMVHSGAIVGRGHNPGLDLDGDGNPLDDILEMARKAIT